jgi:Na+-transporting NADH:ubiquinone oxidoreductase subunit D
VKRSIGTWKLLKENVLNNNPVAVQIIGICSALAVTNNLTNTLIMTLGVAFSTAFSSLTLSFLKNFIPQKVRMIIQVLVLSFYVILIDILLRAFLPDISKALGPYIGLIITNCILMGRAEAFAKANPPIAAFWDGLTSGIGYMVVLMSIAFVREILGFGSVFGIRVMPESFVPWTIMVMAPSAFFMLALFIWIHHSLVLKKGSEKK